MRIPPQSRHQFREEHTAEQVKQLLAEKDALSSELLEFIETVLVYKLPNLSREEIRIMLALNDVKLKQTRFYQEIAAEERSEGRQEGRLEGKLEGEVQIIVRQLNRRFGVLPTWAQQNWLRLIISNWNYGVNGC
jgi:predicted transposase YdaD